MRIVVTGATGNVGTSVVRALAAHEAVETVVGLARRLPELRIEGVTWARADVAVDALQPLFSGADAVIHLAWLIQPSRDEQALERVNVVGSRRVFDAAVAAGVPAIVHASSVGAYSPGAKDQRVDESWPTDGIASSYYSRQKVAVERQLDEFEVAHPDTRIVRLRPGLIFKRTAGAGIRRLFAGPFLPGSLLRPDTLPVLPSIDGLRVQVVHTDDVAQAYVGAVVRDVRGAFNVATEPAVDPALLARLFSARLLPLGRRLARGTVEALWRMHLQPTSPGWLDLGLGVPLLDVSRARNVLGWTPQHDAESTVKELLKGLRESAGEQTPPLATRTSGPLRVREFLTGIGARSTL
jgi:UDP-glucose 4-epimerase